MGILRPRSCSEIDLVAIVHNIFEFCIIRIFWSGTLYYSKVPRGVSWSRTFRYSTSQHWFENIKKFHQISEYSDIACMGAPFKNASWCIFFLHTYIMCLQWFLARAQLFNNNFSWKIASQTFPERLFEEIQFCDFEQFFVKGTTLNSCVRAKNHFKYTWYRHSKTSLILGSVSVKKKNMVIRHVEVKILQKTWSFCQNIA